jgi:hypothetical protein
MGAPDILGLQEIQDNDGATGTDSTVSRRSKTTTAQPVPTVLLPLHRSLSRPLFNEIDKISSDSNYQFIDNTLRIVNHTAGAWVTSRLAERLLITTVFVNAKLPCLTHLSDHEHTSLSRGGN